ncbi:uncharacterized protein B0T15DRAFT_496182 [Chaetomium strumarium]|uniref:C2H2-type domain-containing protein n=1 Tax=Chaetomium strumarium TaxID=1170767 RepID=A0AAJ0GPB1_9PEZI|nr:hypothetical protein B0T15DRAFT_496182 [Chaetomium strumarium]
MAPFGSILELKHHIVSCHGRKSRGAQCRRCKLEFDTEIGLERHLLLPRDQMCEVQASSVEDPESGITGEIAGVLMARDGSGETWSWEGLWRLVFPDDVEVPEPDFQPIVELVEVEQVFEESQEALKASLRETLGLLLPGVTDNDYLNFLTGQLELVFETHRVNIMKQSASRCWSATGGEQLQGQGSQRRPDRKSKRNTLLKSIQRSTQDAATSTAVNKHFRSRSPRDTAASFSERISRRNMTPQTYEVVASHDINNPTASTDEQYTSNPRDSCDSGIGIPCDKCTTEQCSCRETRHSEDDKAGTHKLRRETKEPNEKEPQTQSRPRLSIRTEGNWVTEVMGMEGTAVSGGRFSPESFKQRLLRKQFTSA